MALAPFFDRIYGAVGAHLAVSRRSLTASLESTVVGVECGAPLSGNDKFISEMIVNLVARLYPTLAISGHPESIELLKPFALEINPNIQFAPEAPAETTICIGPSTARGALYPSASGWVARLAHNGPAPSGPTNPYSSAAAASLACGELFRRIFLRSEPEGDFSLSLLDFGSETGEQLELDAAPLGRVLFVGVGAIGNAAIWTLARDTEISGTLILIDHELLSLSNLQRYVLGRYVDVSKSKVLLAAEHLSVSKITTATILSSIEEFAPPEGWEQPPTTCVSVDNIVGRRVVQGLLPETVINGWTGEASLGASWHQLGRDVACLACLYQPHSQGSSATQQAARALGLSEERAALLWVTRAPLSNEERKHAAKQLGIKPSALNDWKTRPLPDIYTDVVCGAVPIDIQAVGRIEVVPLAHQSVLAGSLMAAELIKRTQSSLRKLSQPEPLVVWDNILKPPPKSWVRPRPREAGCICTDSVYQQLYREKWGNRKDKGESQL
jgi:hypothetical protein